MSGIQIFDYNGNGVTFRKGDYVMVSATEMAKPFGKLVGDRLRLKSTNEFLNALSTDMQIPISELIQSVKGGTGEQGTWLHEDAAIEFARWLSPAFAIWCNDIVSILKGKSLTNEIWLDVIGTNGRYQVSTKGSIRAINYLKTGKMKLLSQANVNGYRMVQIPINGKIRNCLVHRLVAETFLPNPHNLPQVNHKDEDKSNNRVENLEWCSAKYNNEYNGGIDKRILTRSLHNPNNECYVKGMASRITNKSWNREQSVCQVLNGVVVDTFKSTQEAQRVTGIKSSNISECCRNIRKRAGGYEWFYMS